MGVSGRYDLAPVPSTFISTIMAESHPAMHDVAHTKRLWEPPRVILLPRLSQLMLATGVPGVNEPPLQGGVIP